ncbi:hypothetical protein ABZP36_007935, partial [Zizania latifolia]
TRACKKVLEEGGYHQRTEAVEEGDTDAIEKFSKRTVKVTKQHNEDCKRLLRLMGVPVVEIRRSQHEVINPAITDPQEPKIHQKPPSPKPKPMLIPRSLDIIASSVNVKAILWISASGGNTRSGLEILGLVRISSTNRVVDKGFLSLSGAERGWRPGRIVLVVAGETAFSTVLQEDRGMENIRIMDSGCSRHMTGHRRWFSSLSPTSSKEFITFGDNGQGQVMTSYPGELLHMDTVGPARVRSVGGKWYVLVVVDDFSRYSWVLFLESKDEVFQFVHDLVLRLKNESKGRMRAIRFDN